MSVELRKPDVRVGIYADKDGKPFETVGKHYMFYSYEGLWYSLDLNSGYGAQDSSSGSWQYGSLVEGGWWSRITEPNLVADLWNKFHKWVDIQHDLIADIKERVVIPLPVEAKIFGTKDNMGNLFYSIADGIGFFVMIRLVTGRWMLYSLTQEKVVTQYDNFGSFDDTLKLGKWVALDCIKTEVGGGPFVRGTRRFRRKLEL